MGVSRREFIAAFLYPMESQTSPEIENLIQLAYQRELSGDISGALSLARQALKLANSGDLPMDCARSLTAVARYRFRLGQYETAREHAQAVREMTDPLQDAQAPIHTEALLLLGMCALETNSMAECEGYYRAAAGLAREIGHPMLLQRAMHNLGSGVYLFRGQFELAIAADLQSIQICREKKFWEWAVFPLITLAIAYQITDQRIRTQEILSELCALAQPGSGGDGYAGYVAGMLALDQDEFQTAHSELSRALSTAEKMGDPSLNLDTRLGFSRLYRLQGEIAKALAWSEDALNFAQRVGYRIYQGRARVEHGRAGWLTGNLSGAEDELLQAEAIFLEMDLRYDLAETRLLLAALYHQKNDDRAVERLLQVTAAVRAGGYNFLLERERSHVYALAFYLNDPHGEIAESAAELIAEIKDVPPKPLKVITFGNFQVWMGAKMVEGRILRQRHAGELLALLLSSPGYSLTIDQVTEALCPEKAPGAAADFYHHAVAALRHLLEPDLPDRRFACRYLEVGEERIGLILPAGSNIDFLEFEQMVHKKNWEQSVALYQGEFLPAYLYAEWTISLRQRLADQFEQALLALAAQRLAAGDPEACLKLARRALLHNAWQEQAVAMGMRAALALGDRATAIKLYQRLEKDLEKDLGIAPQEELQRLKLEVKKRRALL